MVHVVGRQDGADGAPPQHAWAGRRGGGGGLGGADGLAGEGAGERRLVGGHRLLQPDVVAVGQAGGVRGQRSVDALIVFCAKHMVLFKLLMEIDLTMKN